MKAKVMNVTYVVDQTQTTIRMFLSEALIYGSEGPQSSVSVCLSYFCSNRKLAYQASHDQIAYHKEADAHTHTGV